MKIGDKAFVFDWSDITDETADLRSAAIRKVITALVLSYEKVPTEEMTVLLTKFEMPHGFLDAVAAPFTSEDGLFEGQVSEIFIRLLTGHHGVEIVINEKSDDNVLNQKIVIVFLNNDFVVPVVVNESINADTVDSVNDAQPKGLKGYHPLLVLLNRRVRLSFAEM